MADGRIITGFSRPYVAKYTESNGTVTYTNGMPLARGVEVQIEPESTDDNNFYANNLIAENEAGVFNGGTLTLTVDGLKDAANTLIYGLPEADNAGWANYGNTQAIPHCGVGFVIRYQESGTISFVPMILTKVMFNEASTTATTQEEEIDWQTQELTAQIFRDDTSAQVWKKLGTAQTSESAAETAIKTFLNIT